LGFGFGAFLVSFLPLSLFPMASSLTQKALREKGAAAQLQTFHPFAILLPIRYDS
jgi:hypothetical protein